MHTQSLIAEPRPAGAECPLSPVRSHQVERFYRTLLDNLPQRVFLKDRQSRFLVVNGAFAGDFSKPPEEFPGHSDYDLFSRELADKYFQDDQRIMASGQPEKLVEQNILDGLARYVEVTKTPVLDDSGEVIGLLGIFTDVTVLKRADAEAKRSQAFLNSVIENLPIMVFIKRAEDLRIMLWNHASEDLTGWKAADVIGKSDTELFGEQGAAFAACDRHVLASGTLVDIPEEVNHTPHKGARIVHTRKIPIYDEHGAPQYLVGIAEDITEQKAAEEKLRQFAAQLEHNNRELQDFAYVASHDLQEPLRKVRAFGDRLQTKCGSVLSDEGKDFLSRMVNAAQRMQGLIQDLLDFSRVTTRAQPFVRVDLNKIACEVVSDLEVRIEQTGARVEVADLPTIDADATQMRQLLQNLVGNALKFHKKDTAPHVKVFSRDLPAERSDRRLAAPRQFELCVEDNGIGFDEKYLDRIFTVFQRLHGRGEYEGTGVGLAICRKIALRHGGDIGARSKPGAGATFIVKLPMQQPKHTL
jgi:two-component system, LuxR family, sensor kinase FixL